MQTRYFVKVVSIFRNGTNRITFAFLYAFFPSFVCILRVRRKSKEAENKRGPETVKQPWRIAYSASIHIVDQSLSFGAAVVVIITLEFILFKLFFQNETSVEARHQGSPKQA